MAITHLEFARQAAYLAKNASDWSGDTLILPEKAQEPMRDWSVRKFVTYVREMADRIEQMHCEESSDDC